MMAKIVVDGSAWPLVRVTLPPKASNEEVQAYLDELRTYRERREFWAVVVDSTASWGFNAKQRRMQADYIASGIELSRYYLKALAFVAGSQLQRGMLTAIFWLKPPQSPHRVFSSVWEAEAWARKMLEPTR
jgi:hypothetical protein